MTAASGDCAIVAAAFPTVFTNPNQCCSGQGVQCDFNFRITSLEIHGQQLGGPIPISFGQLSELKELRLPSNELTGTIPSSFANLTNLEKLSLDNNQLSGPGPNIPVLPKLQLLSLSNNSFSGPVPDYSNLPSLQDLDLSNNQYIGTIPISLTKITNLTLLVLNDNQLSGEIPDFSPLKYLSGLYFEGNLFSGPIPDHLGNLDIYRLGISYNKFSGSIPNSIVLLSKRADNIYIRENCLTGGIPPDANNATIDYYPQNSACSDDINPPGTGGIGGIGGIGNGKFASSKSSVVSKTVFVAIVVLGALLSQF
ncbi:hypothetical protein HDU76_006948 [Blyttiomyces sp. JEL0837]|nr:hypothetical protein HDU76_006948 [Blyttiomyces sp. JEL0837]